MKSQYFCVFHAQRLQIYESEAITAWSQTMRQGMKAYTECRTGDAYTYLGAAVDIALLRSECESNGVFSELHLIKPAEFLIQLQVAEHRLDAAARLLDTLSTSSALPTPVLGPTLMEFVDFERKHIESTKMSQQSRQPLPCCSGREPKSATIYPFLFH